MPRSAAHSLTSQEAAAATDILDRHIKRERIPAVIRRPAPELSGRSLLDMADAGQFDELLKAVERMFDLRRIQP